MDLVSVEIYKKTLTGSFVAGSPIEITDTDLTLFLEVVSTNVDPVIVEFYLEYTGADPNAAATTWFRETDEQDSGNGVVSHADVIRTLNENNDDTGLSTGTHRMTLQFTRRAPYARLQARVAGGAAGANLTVTAPYGSKPQSP